jgi:hypothetical protein
MRKTDLVYLLCVFGIAGLITVRSITQATALFPSTSTLSTALGAAGQSRAVDMSRLQPLLDRGALSDHEAEFYEPVGVPSVPQSPADEAQVDGR